jgi:hypothetical protein
VVKPQPNRGLVAGLAAVDEDEPCLSAVTVAELRRGANAWHLAGGAARSKNGSRDVLLRFERRRLT